MKTARRMITMILALILVLALAVPTMAADNNGSISVTGSGTTEYQIYKIFDIEQAANGYKYKLATDWTTFTADDYFSVQNGYAIWKKNTTSVADAAAIAQLAKNFVITNNLTTNITVSVGGSVAVAPGYYLLVPTNGPCGVTLVEENTTTFVEEKSVAEGHPTVEKLVQEDSTQTYGHANNADIGQTINFQTTITAGVNAEKYVLHDDMDEHITFTNAVEVTRDGNVVPQTNNYELVENPGDGCTFHIVFSDTMCASLADDAKIVVRYTGKLVEGALAETNHVNETWMTYTAAAATTDVSKTITQTYEVTVNKVDNANPNNPLAGAGFILRDNVGLYYKWNDTAKKVEWVAKEDATVYTTDATGVIKFVGVDAENFYLEEVVVPNGYTGSTDVSVSTKSTEADKIGANAEVTVVNTLGQALPETGGMGTTVFYVVGIVLVLGALAALVIIKRKETSAQ